MGVGDPAEATVPAGDLCGKWLLVKYWAQKCCGERDTGQGRRAGSKNLSRPVPLPPFLIRMAAASQVAMAEAMASLLGLSAGLGLGATCLAKC